MASLATAFVLGFCLIPRGSLVNRLSLRFTLAITIVDVTKAIMILVYEGVRQDGPLCVAVAFGLPWLTLIYLCLNTAVTLNLQCIVLERKLFNPKWEIKYWIAALTVPTVLTFLPLVFGKLGFDSKTESCKYRDSFSTSTQFWLWGTYLAWSIILSVYNASISAMIFFELFYQKSILDRRECEFSSKAILQNTRSLVYRMAFFSLIPAITQIWYPILRINEILSDENSHVLFTLSVIGTDLPGILNCLVFLTDPALKSVVHSLLSNKKLSNKSNTKDFHEIQPSGNVICTISIEPSKHTPGPTFTEHKEFDVPYPSKMIIAFEDPNPGPIIYIPGTNIPLDTFIKGL